MLISCDGSCRNGPIPLGLAGIIASWVDIGSGGACAFILGTVVITASGALQLQTEHDARLVRFKKSVNRLDKTLSELERKIIIFSMQCSIKVRSMAKLMGCGRTVTEVNAMATSLRASIKKICKCELPVRDGDLVHLHQMLNAAKPPGLGRL